MIYRSYDAEAFIRLHDSPDEVIGFDPDDYLPGSKNVILTDGENFGVFNYVNSDVREAHCFMKARGKYALEVADEILTEIFSVYNVKAVIGLTPVKNKKAQVFNKWLGFKPGQIVETEAGPAVLFTLTQEDFNGQSN